MEAGSARVSHHVGDEPLPPVGLFGHHRAFAPRGVLPDGRFDLPGLDAEAADLHLLIDAPEELEVAGRPVAHQVAGPIQTRRRHRR